MKSLKKNLNIIGFIFARGGSKGLINKNIRMLNGKPLIGWAIEQALSVKLIKRVILSTDSEEISEIGKTFGAEVLFKRPKKFSFDNSSEWLAWRHALNFLKKKEGNLPDIMVSIPPTAPLRASSDINKCIKEYIRGGADIIITVTDAHRNPWFNMIKINKNGLCQILNRPQKGLFRRQDAPKVYDMTTVAYVADPNYVLNQKSHFSGKVKSIFIPKERAIDIDTEFDLEIAQMLIKKKYEKNK